MTLGEFLQAPRPAWDWKQHDCCRWLARWIVANGRPDPMAFIADRYSTRVGALRAIRRGGGLVPLWTRGMAEAGLSEVGTPVPGDVAVLSVLTDDGVDQTCGIWTGRRWACVLQDGLAFGFGSPLRIWRV